MIAYFVIAKSRKYSFVIIDGLGVIGGGLIFISIFSGEFSTYALLGGRVFQGLAAGLSMVACRVYIREYSPEVLLKAMSYIPVFLLTFGQAGSFGITYLAQSVVSANVEIYCAHGIMTIWPIIRMLMIFYSIQETPYFWISKEK